MLQLFAHLDNVFLRPQGRGHLMGNGGIFSGQTKALRQRCVINVRQRDGQARALGFVRGGQIKQETDLVRRADMGIKCGTPYCSIYIT